VKTLLSFQAFPAGKMKWTSAPSSIALATGKAGIAVSDTQGPYSQATAFFISDISHPYLLLSHF